MPPKQLTEPETSPQQNTQQQKPSNLTGTWGGNLVVTYRIQPQGNGYRWWAPLLNQQTPITLLGNGTRTSTPPRSP